MLVVLWITRKIPNKVKSCYTQSFEILLVSYSKHLQEGKPINAPEDLVLSGFPAVGQRTGALEGSRTFHRGSIGRSLRPATHSSPRSQAKTTPCNSLLSFPQTDPLKQDGQEDRYRHWPRHHLLLCRCFPARKGKRTAATYLAKRFFLIFANVFHSKSS